MTPTRKISLEVTDQATESIINQALYYREQSSDGELEARWHDAVTRTVISLLSMPARGAGCRVESLKLRGLRRVAVLGFPNHFVFYLFAAEKQLVRIVEVIHSARDLDSLFSDSPDQ